MPWESIFTEIRRRIPVSVKKQKYMYICPWQAFLWTFVDESLYLCIYALGKPFYGDSSTNPYICVYLYIYLPCSPSATIYLDVDCSEVSTIWNVEFRSRRKYQMEGHWTKRFISSKTYVCYDLSAQRVFHLMCSSRPKCQNSDFQDFEASKIHGHSSDGTTKYITL